MRGRLLGNPVRTGLVVGLLYLLLAGGAVASEWRSDRDKVSTAPLGSAQPFGLSRALAWPVERVVVDPWPEYPAVFTADSYQALVDHAGRELVGAAILQACLIAVVVGGLGLVLRRRRD